MLAPSKRELRAAGAGTAVHAPWVAPADQAGQGNKPDV